MHYNFQAIESKWQEFWAKHKTYKVEDDFSKPKYYILDMFPYPSGQGLHIGHPEGYTASDIVSRYKRMKGFNVLHPMGFDAFGLPAERHAMSTGIHPEENTRKNIVVFKRQLNMLGFDYDWDREINTTTPDYYKWTQWMFLLMYNSWYDKSQKRARNIVELPIPKEMSGKEIEDYKDNQRLAYIAMSPVNWCEELGTVLANEEVDEWKEKGYTVEKRPMRQWMLKITEYAERLLDDLDFVDWPNSTLEMQKHWIGKSEGAQVDFQIENTSKKIEVFTTRPDTIFGATYMVLAPEHPLLEEITTTAQKEKIEKYKYETSLKSDLERGETNKDKTGVFTGSYAINPCTNKLIPILISDYVMMGYGTGAIMAVPAHDQRDFEFAKKFEIPVLQVVAPLKDKDVNIDKEAFTEEGISINSSNDEISINGLKTKDAKKTIIAWLEKNNIGKSKIQYRLRDWLFSRQRYWGEPIPIIYFEDGSKRAFELEELPLELPKDVPNFKPAGTGESPLANIDNWINYYDKRTGKTGKLETNTMPQWSGSCWYFLRYIDPNNKEWFCDAEKEKYWMNVDLYIGGAEHAVLHLLYARFWHKVLFDYGYVSTKEPFKKLFHQGLIMGEDGRKMSKSLGNVVNPDDIVKEFGADSLRMFEMFLGPLEQSKPWSSTGIDGIFRFLNRVWRLAIGEDGELNKKIHSNNPSSEEESILHETIRKVEDDIENLRFNTAISQLMIFVNEYNKLESYSKNSLHSFIKLLSPFAPHICEEIAEKLGTDKESIALEEWPKFDANKIQQTNIEFVVQVLSKIRAKIEVEPGLNQEEIEKIAKSDSRVQKYIDGKEIRKIIFVKDKLINFIAT